MEVIYLRFAMLIIALISVLYAKIFLSKFCRDEIAYFKKKFKPSKRFFVFIFFILNLLFLLIFFNPFFAISTLYASLAWFLLNKIKNNVFFYWFFSFYLLFFFFFPLEPLFYLFVLTILFNLSFFSLFP